MQVDPIDEAVAADKKRRARLALIFGGIVLLLVAGLGISAVTFKRASDRKRTEAWSKLNKCLLGAPPATGTDPYMRFRAIARTRMFDESKDPPERLWPGRCVTYMLAFTDMLKEVGDLKEGDKDLGYYARALEQHTAGDGYKDLDTYPEVLRQFYDEAKKTPFTFVDPSDIPPPPIPVEGKSAAELIAGPPVGKRVALSAMQARVPGSLLYLLRQEAGRASLCTFDGKLALACKPSMRAYARSVVLATEDGAPPLLADDSGIVYRDSDDLVLVQPNQFFYEGGWSSRGGITVALIKSDSAKDPDFLLARANAGHPETKPVTLAGWSREAPTPDVVGSFIVWTNPDGTIHTMAINEQDVGPDVVVGHLPLIEGTAIEGHLLGCLVGGRPAFQVWWDLPGRRKLEGGYVYDGAAWGASERPCKPKLHVRARGDEGVFQITVARLDPAGDDIDAKVILIDTRQDGDHMVKDALISTIQIVGATTEVALLASTTTTGEQHLSAIDASATIHPVSP